MLFRVHTHLTCSDATLSASAPVDGQIEKHFLNFGKIRLADLNALTLFAKVAEAGSFSEAARRLKLPVSTLSRRVADLEESLGVRLLERSTRRLRLTDVGTEVLQQALRGTEVSEAVDSIIADHHTAVTGTLRLAAPPSISDSLLAPIVMRYQAAHPKVRVRLLITERTVDPVADSIDLAFRVGPLAPANSATTRLLVYRHLLVASPAYLAAHGGPNCPQDLLQHRLLAFARGKPRYRWIFTGADGAGKEALSFDPCLAMNDYAGLAAVLLAGVGIGDLPPVVLPHLLASGQLVEIMPQWHFRTFQLTVVHLGSRYVPRTVRLFKELAASVAPEIFPLLPT